VFRGGSRIAPAEGHTTVVAVRSELVRSWCVAASAAVVLLSGCTDAAEAERSSTQTTRGATPVEAVDFGAMTVPRAPFCELIEPAATEKALGGPVRDTLHYDNGDRAEVAPGVTDVAHEYNCTFTGAGSASARAWVFARPVDAEFAARLADGVRSQDGCSIPAGLEFGTPNVTTLCPQQNGSRLSIHGLFDDAWLSCEVTLGDVDPAVVRERGERWCAHVATAVGDR